MAPEVPKPNKGRPSKSSLAKLEEEGRNNKNAKHKCRFCPRVFPRKKNKDAHERTHLGLKPFRCDFPGCRKAFVQSCQLRAHTYLHTGEKPFACPATGCRVRYPHSNRRCSRHKLKLIRDGKEVIRTDLENLSKAQIRWLKLYKEKKFGKATKVSIPKTSPTEVRNVKRKKSAESVHVDEKPFDEEPLISSNPSTSSAHNPEEMNICDSFAQPPKKARFTKKQAALVLISFKNSHISCNPSSSPAHNPEEMNICDSLAQSPKKARFTKKQAALALISFKNSHISSNPSSSPAPNPEEMNIYDSLAQPPKKARFTKKQAALALISLKNSHISSNPSSSPAHNPEEMNICDSFAQPPKKAPLSDKKAALILISLSNGPPRMNGQLEDKKSS